ncbi:hypothetical protein CLOP_g14700 [Closterium sp. NIES-67]|nr:hypothetical protein CLOP_g14700 [Closterium sp. NIES-67]
MSNPPPSPGSHGTDAGTSCAASSSDELLENSTHAIFKHFKFKHKEHGKQQKYWCKYCPVSFTGTAYRCAQHITSWDGMRRREVRKCEEVGKEEQAAVRAFQTAKVLAREEAHRAEESALDAVSGRGKRKITDYLSDDAQAAKAAADEAICLLFAGLRLPERHADHPLWRNAVRSIARAGTSYVPPKRDYVGGAGLQLCRKRIDEGLTGVMSSWKRHGVTIASDMMTDKCGRPQANVMLVNDTGAVFVESIDCKMEKKTGGYIARLLRPILQKEGNYSMEAWWEWHGTDHPLLMALACRVLTQPVSASSCERNWAVWDTVHTARRNRLGSEKCKDLVYVAHNWKVVHNWHMADEGAGVVNRGSFHCHDSCHLLRPSSPNSSTPSSASPFDFSLDYPYVDNLQDSPADLAPDQQSPDASESASHAHFALLVFESEIACPSDALLIASRLDSDIHSNTCRMAFHGHIVAPIDPTTMNSGSQAVRVFKLKSREGVIDRVVDSHSLIGRGLFKKETDITKFVGLRVTTVEGTQGTIQSPFGKSGKFKVVFQSALPKEAIAGAPLHLVFKRLLFDKTKQMLQ